MTLLVNWLWLVYGYTYDGLLHFYPYRELLRKTSLHVGNTDNQRVLEIGTGTGNVLMEIYSPRGTFVGVDISKSMLGAARRKLNKTKRNWNVELIESDILKYLKEEPPASFDVIVSVNVIYALSNRNAVWQEIRRVLKPGGKLVIATSVKTGSTSIIREHLENAGWWTLLRPKLVGVFLVDSLINLLGVRGHFEFPGEDTIASELSLVDFKMKDLEQCYGGVDILFTAQAIR